MSVVGYLMPMLGIFTMAVRSRDEDFEVRFSIQEGSPPHTYVGNIALGAQLDQVYNATIRQKFEYGFISELDDQQLFHVERRTGLLRSTNPIDRELRCPGLPDCSISLSVAITRPVEYFQVISVIVDIEDVNDNAPEFNPSRYTVSFSEADPVGTVRSLPIALDEDSPRYGVQSYRMITANRTFELQEVTNRVNGLTDLRLMQMAPLDRETVDRYEVVIEALDGGRPPMNGTLRVEIIIQDDNDHSPVFRNSSFRVEVPESMPLNATIFKAKARDPDLGDNGRVQYSFAPRTATLYRQLFQIDSRNGEISLRKHLDFETTEEYHLEILASDSGPNSQSSLATLVVKVLDVNDNIPQITISTLNSRREAEVAENLPSGQFAGHVLVQDADMGENGEVECTIVSEAFHLEMMRPNQYKITTAISLDRESVDRYILSVRCWDNGRPSLTSRENLTVLVGDVNDHAPSFEKSEYVAIVEENNPYEKDLLRLNATDKDWGLNAQVSYSILEPRMADYVYILDRSGVIRSRTVLDYEKQHALVFTVMARDRGSPPRSSTASVTINIMDQNDNEPIFSDRFYSFGVLENQEKDTPVGHVTAFDADSPPLDQFEFSLSTPNSQLTPRNLFRIDPSSGEILTQRPLDREEDNKYQLIVFATDTDNPIFVASASVTVNIEDENDNAPVITFPDRNNGTYSMSTKVPIGSNITRIFASDADIGQNAKLHYKISSISLQHDRSGKTYLHRFLLDEETGLLSTNFDFQSTTQEYYNIDIVVSDSGVTAMETRARLVIKVDENIPYIPPGQAALVKNRNLTIIITVAAISGFIIVVLIIAIVLLKSMDRRRTWRGKEYNCRQAEEQKILNDLNLKGVEANGRLNGRQFSGTKGSKEEYPMDLKWSDSLGRKTKQVSDTMHLIF